jgi:LmbE family N-acetylglucosaminyl deacetylase
VTAGFDHRIDGTPEASWRAEGFDEWLTVQLPGPDARVLVIAAHPDDETLGAGGLMAELAARGAQVRVVIATDGEASHPLSPTHTPMQLAEIRRAEVRAALAELHPALHATFLGLPDGELAQHPEALATMLVAHVQDCTHVITPWLGDRHPDHVACATAANRIRGRRTRHWQYPIWAWHWDDPQAMVLPAGTLRRLMIGPAAVDAKHRALGRHRSQTAPLSAAAGDEAVLSPEMVAHFERDFECFIIDAPAASSEYFDDLYENDDDPWRLAERFYERRKRDLVLAALPRERFVRTFEPGCATGLLTEQLAARSDAVVAWDAAAAAVRQARHRLRDHDHVEIGSHRIPTDWPDGQFDLVVISEVGYYCPDLDELADRIRGGLTRDGVVLAVHWRHDAVDHPHTAQAVHDAIGARLIRIVAHVEADFLLDVWTRTGTSVAAAEGVVGNSTAE